MARRGEGSGFDVEKAFVCWYDHGRRRSYREVAQLLEVSYEKVRRTACDHDWLGRAEQLDRETREIVNTRLLSPSAQAKIQVAEVAIADIVKFSWRLADSVRDQSGTVIPNPYRLEPGELSVADMLRAVKMLQAADLIGHGSTVSEAQEPLASLQELRDELAEMYLREEKELIGLVAAEATPASPDT